MQIRPFSPSDQAEVISLWQKCGLLRPWNDPARDIARKLNVQPGLFLTGGIDGAVMATAMGGYDGHRGSIYYLAVAPEHRGKGYGRMLVGALEVEFEALGCPKINVMIRSSNTAIIGFYHQIDYRRDDVAVCGKRLIADG